MGTQRTLERFDNTIKIYQDTYTTSEVNTEISGSDSIDLGTIDCSSEDNYSAAGCVHIDSADEKIHNLKAMVSSKLPGVSFKMDVDDADLTASLSSAGTDASYSIDAPGKFEDWQSVTVTTGESKRIQFQAVGTKDKVGTLPYDPTKDEIPYPASLFLYWEEDSYKQRNDVIHGKKPADMFKDVKGIEMFTLMENGSLVSIGDIDVDSAPTLETTVETTEITKGYPKETIKENIEKSMFKLSGTLEINDRALTVPFKDQEYVMDSTTGLWVAKGSSPTELKEAYFLLVMFTVGGYIRFLSIPKGEIKMFGSENLGGGNNTVQFNINCKTDTNGNAYYDYQSSNVAYFLEIDLKAALTVA